MPYTLPESWKIFSVSRMITNRIVYCSMHCIFTAVKQCSTHQTRCVCYKCFYLVCVFCIRYMTCRMTTLSCSDTLIGFPGHWHINSTFKSFQTTCSLDKPSLITTLHEAEVHRYLFLSKTAIAQNIVIETWNVYLLSYVTCEHFWLLCVCIVLFISDCFVGHSLWYLKMYTLKYSKLEFCMLFSCTAAQLWKNMGIL
jgi:hypothetical protein